MNLFKGTESITITLSIRVNLFAKHVRERDDPELSQPSDCGEQYYSRNRIVSDQKRTFFTTLERDYLRRCLISVVVSITV